MTRVHRPRGVFVFVARVGPMRLKGTMANKTVAFEIKRQASPDAPAVWEKFELEWRPGMNVISSMMEIATNPVTADGRPTTPITYDSNCLEEICGSCAMRI